MWKWNDPLVIGKKKSIGGGNAQPADVLSGKTFTNDQGEQVGTMPNRTGHVTGQSISRSGTTLRIRPQEGYYPGDSGNSVAWDDPNWIAANIRQGVSIFGLEGTLDGRRWASGTAAPTDINNNKFVVVSGLAFQPRVVFAYATQSLLSSTETTFSLAIFPAEIPNLALGGVFNTVVCSRSGAGESARLNNNSSRTLNGFSLYVAGVNIPSFKWYAFE